MSSSKVCTVGSRAEGHEVTNRSDSHTVLCDLVLKSSQGLESWPCCLLRAFVSTSVKWAQHQCSARAVAVKGDLNSTEHQDQCCEQCRTQSTLGIISYAQHSLQGKNQHGTHGMSVAAG